MYVEPLIGPQTVNTLPRKTIATFADDCTVAATLEQGLEEAIEVMRDLANGRNRSSTRDVTTSR